MWSANLLRLTMACIVVALDTASEEVCYDAENRQQKRICSSEDNSMVLYGDSAFNYAEYKHQVNPTKVSLEELHHHKTIAVTTVTRVIFIDQPQSTPESSCSAPKIGLDVGPSKQDIKRNQEAAYKRASTGMWSLISKPFQIVKAIVSAFLSYIAIPAWLVSCWVARVMIYKPAVFIYLLFLEKPFKAMLSLFLWILPLLAFVIATTVTGTVIGGTFGWISALVSNIFQSSASSNVSTSVPYTDIPFLDSPNTADTSDVSATPRCTSERYPIARKHLDQASDGRDFANNQDESSPGLWTRRRLTNKHQL